MLRLPLVLMSTMLAMILVVRLAYALPEGPGGSGIPKKMPTSTGGLLATLLLPGVQIDLNLSNEQKVKVRQLTMVQRASGKYGPSPGTIPDPGRLPSIPPGSEAERISLTEILTPQQMERLKQIDLQVQGIDALKNPEVIGALGLTLEQREKLNAAFKKADKQLHNPALATVGGMMAMGLVPGQSEQELKEEVLKVLTPEQRKKFEKMKGKQINLTRTIAITSGAPLRRQNAPPGSMPPAGTPKGSVPLPPQQN